MIFNWVGILSNFILELHALSEIYWTLVQGTQQDYYGRRGGTLIHSYYTGSYTEVTVLLLWGNSAVTMEHPHSYSVGVPAWVQGSIGASSKKQHCYFSVGTSAVTV